MLFYTSKTQILVLRLTNERKRLNMHFLAPFFLSFSFFKNDFLFSKKRGAQNCVIEFRAHPRIRFMCPGPLSFNLFPIALIILVLSRIFFDLT